MLALWLTTGLLARQSSAPPATGGISGDGDLTRARRNRRELDRQEAEERRFRQEWRDKLKGMVARAMGDAEPEAQALVAAAAPVIVATDAVPRLMDDLSGLSAALAAIREAAERYAAALAEEEEDEFMMMMAT